MKLIQDPSQPLSRIVGLLRTDSVTTAEVLRLANSPLFGCRSEVRNILHAVALMGADRISSFIFTTAMKGLADTRRSTLAHSCWRHCLTTALLSECLSALMALPSEKSYIAGLIHDIGRLALLRVFPEYEPALQRTKSKGVDLLAAERAVCEIDHCEAGRWLLCQWGCPIELQNVAAYHENPPATQTLDKALISVVCASSQLAELMEAQAAPSDLEERLPKIALTFPEASRQSFIQRFPITAEWVITRVNSIEQSLL